MKMRTRVEVTEKNRPTMPQLSQYTLCPTPTTCKPYTLNSIRLD